MARPDEMAQKKTNDNGLKKDPEAGKGLENEGEGNKTAGRRYNDATQKYVESGKVGPAAEQAEQALDGAEGEELEQAEEEGKRRAADHPASRDKRQGPPPRVPSPR